MAISSTPPISPSEESSPKFCCWYFKQCIEDKTIITKEQAFPESQRWTDQNFFKMHPKYVMYVADSNPLKAGWHWFHYCNNCGHKYSTDVEISYWDNSFNKPNIPENK